jgi:hypothetical protein
MAGVGTAATFASGEVRGALQCRICHHVIEEQSSTKGVPSTTGGGGSSGFGGDGGDARSATGGGVSPMRRWLGYPRPVTRWVFLLLGGRFGSDFAPMGLLVG